MKSLRIPAFLLAIVMLTVTLTGCDAKNPVAMLSSSTPAVTDHPEFTAMKLRAEKAETELSSVNVRAAALDLQLTTTNAQLTTARTQNAELSTQLTAATGWVPSVKHSVFFLGLVFLGYLIGYRIHHPAGFRATLTNYMRKAQIASDAIRAASAAASPPAPSSGTQRIPSLVPQP